MSIDTHKASLQAAILKLTPFANALGERVDQTNTKALAGLVMVVLENAMAVERQLSAEFHGGMIEIVRSQMEAAADCMLLLKDDKYFSVLERRQNDTVVKVTNRARANPQTMLGVSRALQDTSTSELLEKAYQKAKSSNDKFGNIAFVESVARAGLGEDNYRYLCSFAHHNLTALNIRYFSEQKKSSAVDRIRTIPIALLEFLVRQATANVYGVLMCLAEKASLSSK